ATLVTRHCCIRRKGTRFVVISRDSDAARRSTGLSDGFNVEPEASQSSNDETTCRDFGFEQRMLARATIRLLDELAVEIDRLPAPFCAIGGLAGLFQQLDAASIANIVLALDRGP